MNTTTNLGLKKPEYSDPADIKDINDNMDTLDGKLGAVGNTSVQGQIDAINTKVGSTALPTTAQTLTGAIAEHETDLGGKASKVADAVEDNFASLDEAGNLKDSGKNASDFSTPADTDKKANAIEESNSTPAEVMTFADGADDMPMEVEVAINPVQSGSGDPSPSNIRPITGWSSVKITRTGRNLANPVDARPAQLIQSTTGNMVGNGDHTAYITFIPVKPFAKYTLSATNIHKRESNTSNAYVNVVEYSDADRTTYLRSIVNSNNSDPSYTFTISEDAKYIRFSVGIGATDVQLEMGENVSAFEPYTGCDKYNITFPDGAGTVYGGTLTINEDGSGKLVVTNKCVAGNSFTWTKNSTYNCFSANFNDKKPGLGYDTDTQLPNGTLISDSYAVRYETLSAITNGTIRGHATNTNLYIRDDSCADATEFNTHASDFHIYYELATATEYTLTAQQIRSLLGENNLWADSGNVLSVVYYADTKMYIDNKDALPAVSASDNGKVLRVVNGEWAVASLDSALNVSF